MNQQNEPPRIQSEGRQIEVGKEVDCCEEKLRNRQKRKRRKITFQQGKHNYSPSTWDIWIMAEYRQDHKSFPDWTPVWKDEKYKRKARESWSALPLEVRRGRNQRRPKDMDRRNRKMREANQRRLAESPHHRTINSLRSRFRKFYTGGASRSIGKLLGCTLPEFKKHLELQFKKGMTWKNYGSHWHVDHIIPCAHFDHNDPAQVAACWHWTNMQPLEAKENMSKGKRIKAPQMNLRMEFAA